MRSSLSIVLVVALLATAVAAVGAGASPTTAASHAVLHPGGDANATIAKKKRRRTSHRRRRVCDRNYRGRCLQPNAGDYDCAGGSGNGPYYVRGPFRVVGRDHYGLDSDGDGIACES